MKRLAPGVYDDGDGGLHLDVGELLEANGWPDTDANRDEIELAAGRLFGSRMSTTNEAIEVEP